MKYLSLTKLLDTLPNTRPWFGNAYRESRTHDYHRSPISFNYIREYLNYTTVQCKYTIYVFVNNHLFVRQFMTTDNSQIHSVRDNIYSRSINHLRADPDYHTFIIPEFELLTHESVSSLYKHDIYMRLLDLLIQSIDESQLIDHLTTYSFDTPEEALGYTITSHSKSQSLASKCLRLDTKTMFDMSNEHVFSLVYLYHNLSKIRIYDLDSIHYLVDSISPHFPYTRYQIDNDPELRALEEIYEQQFSNLKQLVVDKIQGLKDAYLAQSTSIMPSPHLTLDQPLPQDMKATIRLELNHLVDMGE